MFLSWDAVTKVEESAGNIIGRLAKKTGTSVCGWYRKYPNSWVLSTFGRGVLQSVCPLLGEDLPTSDYPDFTGAQCDKLYNVGAYCTAELWDKGSGCPGTLVKTVWLCGRLANVSGAIEQVYFTPHGSNLACPGLSGTYSQIIWKWQHNGGIISESQTGLGQWRDTAPTNFSECIRDNLGSQTRYYFRNAGGSRGYFLDPVDGVDDCGDPQPVYPPDQPRSPDDFQGNYTINNTYEGDEDNDNALTIPFAYIPISPEFKFPIKFDLGGIDVNIDAGGFEFDFGDEGGSADIEDEIANIDRKTSQINSKLDELLKDKKKPFDPFAYIPLTPIDVEGEAEVEDEDIEWVRVTVTVLPEKGKWFKTDNAESLVVHAGYICWTYGDNYSGAGIPIRYQYNQYEKPEGAIGYRIYAINRAKLKVEAFKPE